MFLVLGALASFLYCGVPMNGGSDSAWYYMNAHYLLTGQYIWETGYSSFTGPSQFFFPHGGYSLFIYVTRLLESPLGVSWIVMLRVIQLGAYLASAWLVYAIGSRFKHGWAGLAGMICFFLYAPFLGYATTLLSETITTCLVLLVIWLFLKGILENRKPLLCLCFFLGGYGVLLKPVLWPVVGLLAITMIACQWRARPVGLWLLAVSLTAVCPLAQSIESKVVFGNYRIRAGSGMNLWNRVIAQDQCFPDSSPEGKQIGEACVYKFPVKRGKWWLAASYFSKVRGYSKEQTEEIITRIAWQGLLENKPLYAVRTARQIWMLLLADTQVPYNDIDPATPYGFKGPDQAEPQQLPLVRELTRQNNWCGQGVLGGLPARLYSRLADGFVQAQGGHLQVFIAFGYLGMLLATVLGLRRRDPERLATLATFLAPGLIIVGSCLAEAPDQRFRLPAEPLLILACCVGAYVLVTKAYALQERLLPAGASLRRRRAYACLPILAIILIVAAGFYFNLPGNMHSLISDENTCNARGVQRLNDGDLAGALREFNLAIEINPRYAAAYYNRGTAFLRKGDAAQAVRDQTKAIELDPVTAAAYLNRGSAHLALKEADLAIQDYTKAIELEPNAADAYLNRGSARLAQREIDLAIQDYTKAIELEPNLADAYCNRGIAFLNKGDSGPAVLDFTKEIELRPNLADVYVCRAEAYRLQKRYDPAWADVRQCRRLGGNPPPEVIERLTRESGRSE